MVTEYESSNEGLQVNLNFSIVLYEQSWSCYFISVILLSPALYPQKKCILVRLIMYLVLLLSVYYTASSKLDAACMSVLVQAET